MDDIPLLQDLYAALSQSLPRWLRPYLDPTLTVLAAAAIAVLARVTVLRWLQRLSATNAVPYDDIVVDSLKRRAIAWTVLGTVFVQLEALPWRPRSITVAQNIVAAVLIMSVTLALVRLVSKLASVHATSADAGVGGTTLVRYISTALLIIVGLVSVLALFGISVVPMFTALGVGGLAVALAFQDTLANVFSGVNLTLARQIRVGDYIELGEHGELEGFIADIGWRATTLRTLSGTQIFIPNKKLAESVMVNYSRSDAGMSVTLEFRVGHDEDPERVEAVVLDEMLRATADIPGIRAEEPPVVRFKAFAESALEFKAFVAIRNFQERFLITHTLMKRLHRRLKREQITVPVPHRAVRMLAAAPGPSVSS
jgi:small-conductance mechanosensitive channel